MYIFEPPSKNGGREKRLYYLLRSRGEILLHFSFSFHTRGQDEDFYSIFSYRCLEIFASPLEIRSLFVRINLSFLVPFLSRGRRSREGREGRDRPSIPEPEVEFEKLFDRGGRGERSADRIEQMLIAYTCSRPLSGR